MGSLMRTPHLLPLTALAATIIVIAHHLTAAATTAITLTLQATTPTAPTPMPIAHGMLDIMTTTTVHTLIPMVGKTTTTGEKKKNNTQDSTRVVDLPSSETWILPGTKLTHGVKPGAIKLALSMPIAMVETLNAVS